MALWFSSNMVALADAHIKRCVLDKEDESLCNALQLRRFLVDVMKRKGSILYVCEGDVPVEYENVIFKGCKRYKVGFGISRDDYEDCMDVISCIKFCGKWHDITTNSTMRRDFAVAAENAFNDADRFDFDVVGIDNLPCVALCYRDTVREYKQYCFAVDKSNWKYVAAAAYKCIRDLVSN